MERDSCRCSTSTDRYEKVNIAVMQIRGAGVVRWMASDGHSPYIGENGNWWQWNDAVNDYVDTGVSAKGVPGMPGQVPVQKEWKAGDTHRNDTNIVDYIYVRAPIPDNRKWYKLKNDYVVREVPSDETYPSESTLSTYYDEIPWLKELAAKVLIGEEANLANLIFKDDKLISLRGTVDGVAADYSGQADFVPNIVIDGKTGKITAKNADIQGRITSSYSGKRIIIDPDSSSLSFKDEANEIRAAIGFDDADVNNKHTYIALRNSYSTQVRHAADIKPGYLSLSSDYYGGAGTVTTIMSDCFNSVLSISQSGRYGSNGWVRAEANYSTGGYLEIRRIEASTGKLTKIGITSTRLTITDESSNSFELRVDGIYKNGVKVL